MTALSSTGGGGDWDVAGTWTPAQVPTAADDLTVTSGNPVTCPDTVTCLGNICSVQSGGILTLDATTVLNLADDLFIESGGKIQTTNTDMQDYATIIFPTGGTGLFDLAGTGIIEMEYVHWVAPQTISFHSGNTGWMRHCAASDLGTSDGIIQSFGGAVEVTDFAAESNGVSNAVLIRSNQPEIGRWNNVYGTAGQSVLTTTTNTDFKGYGISSTGQSSRSTWSSHIDGYQQKPGSHIRGDDYTTTSTTRNMVALDSFPFAIHPGFASGTSDMTLHSEGLRMVDAQFNKFVRRGVTIDGNVLVSKWKFTGTASKVGHVFTNGTAGGESVHAVFNAGTTVSITVLTNSGGAFSGSASGTQAFMTNATGTSVINVKTRYEERTNRFVDMVMWIDGTAEPAFGAFSVTDPGAGSFDVGGDADAVSYRYENSADAALNLPTRGDIHYVGVVAFTPTDGSILQEFEYWDKSYASASSTGLTHPMFRFDTGNLYRQWASDAGSPPAPTTEATDDSGVFKITTERNEVQSAARGFLFQSARTYDDIAVAGRWKAGATDAALLLAWDLDNLTGYRVRLTTSTNLRWEKYDGATWTTIGSDDTVSALSNGDTLVAEIKEGTLQAYTIPSGGDVGDITPYGASRPNETTYTTGYVGWCNATAGTHRMDLAYVMSAAGMEDWVDTVECVYDSTAGSGENIDLAGGDLNLHGGLVASFNEPGTGRSAIKLTNSGSTIRTVNTSETSRVVMKSTATDPFTPTTGYRVLISADGGLECEYADWWGCEDFDVGSTGVTGYLRHGSIMSNVLSTSIGVFQTDSASLDVRDMVLRSMDSDRTMSRLGGSTTTIYRDCNMLGSSAEGVIRIDSSSRSMKFVSSVVGDAVAANSWVRSYWDNDTTSTVHSGATFDPAVTDSETLAYYGFRWTATALGWKLAGGVLEATSASAVIKSRVNAVNEITSLYVKYTASGGGTVDIEWYDEDMVLLETDSAVSTGGTSTRTTGATEARYFRFVFNASASGDTIDAIECRAENSTGVIFFNDNFNLALTEYDNTHTLSNSMEMVGNFADGQSTNAVAIAEDDNFGESYVVRAHHGSGEAGILSMVDNRGGQYKGYLLKPSDATASATWKLYDWNLSTGTGTELYDTTTTVTSNKDIRLRVMDDGLGSSRVWVAVEDGAYDPEITTFTPGSNPGYTGGKPGMLLNSTVGDFEVTSLPGCDIYWTGKVTPEVFTNIQRIAADPEVKAVTANTIQDVTLDFPTMSKPVLSNGELRWWCKGSDRIVVEPTSTSVTINYDRYCTLYIGTYGDIGIQTTIDWFTNFSTATDQDSIIKIDGRLVMFNTNWQNWPLPTFTINGLAAIYHSTGNYRDTTATHLLEGDWHIVCKNKSEGHRNYFVNVGGTLHDVFAGTTVTLPPSHDITRMDFSSPRSFVRQRPLGSNASGSRFGSKGNNPITVVGQLSYETADRLTYIADMGHHPITISTSTDFMYFDMEDLQHGVTGENEEVNFSILGVQKSCP